MQATAKSKLKFVTLLSVAALMRLTGAAWAEDVPDCKNPDGRSAEVECADLGYQKADKALNAFWPKVKADAENSDKGTGKHEYMDALLAAQRTWIAFRDAQCKYEGLQNHGGTGEMAVILDCLSRLTNERIKQLKDGM